uniref:SCAN box domain-containing protein n=1 Tax=Crocodylus porosus TaxID=8502 RepID=A0A7M4E2S0_CROPO
MWGEVPGVGTLPVPLGEKWQQWLGPSTLKDEILRRLDIMPERHCQVFRGRQSREAKAPRLLWQSLTDLMNKWLRLEATSKEEICDKILLEQFIADLDEDTQKQVRCHRVCKTGSLKLQGCLCGMAGEQRAIFMVAQR